MIDLEKIKNEVAVKHGYNMWLDILGVFSTSTDISYLQLIELENQVATEYARQMCHNQIISCANEVIDEDYFYEVVLNTPNVVNRIWKL